MKKLLLLAILFASLYAAGVTSARVVDRCSFVCCVDCPKPTPEEPA